MYDFLKLSDRDIKNKHTPGIDNYRDNTNQTDFFGFAWLDHATWKIYKQPTFYVNDPNLENVINHMKKHVVIGHIKWNKSKHPKILDNGHPIFFQNNVMVHNGHIREHKTYRDFVMGLIKREYIKEIRGETDTELLLFLFLTILEKNMLLFKQLRTSSFNVKIHPSAIASEECFKKANKLEIYKMSIIEMLHIFEKNDIEFLATMIFSNKTHTFALRYIYYNKANYNTDQYPNSLYFEKKDDSLLVVSEPVTTNYTLFPMNTAMVINHNTMKSIHFVIPPLS